MADILQEFKSLFKGSEVTHGHSVLLDRVTDKGKHETRAWTEKGPPTDKDWEAHLAGKQCLGVSPIRGDGTIAWAAIDVDEYDGSLEDLSRRISELSLPMVVCRSKSGGPHVYMFFKEFVPAKTVISKLDEIGSYLGYGTSEIFPKQDGTGSPGNPESGNWINLPYFGGAEYLRYALNSEGKGVLRVEEFVNMARDRALSKSDLESLKLPEQQDFFPEGPPCLNRIWSPDSPQDMRNIALSNAIVYLKKARPDDWENAAEEMNRKLRDPLPMSEVQGTIRSHKKTDYRYQCSKEPLCRYCNASKCKTLRHGITGGAGMPGLKSLTKLNTEPPLWYLSVSNSRGEDQRIQLSTSQLQDVRSFQLRAMETINEMPSMIKREHWEELLQTLFKHMNVIEVARELKPQGQFDEMLMEFLTTRVSNEANRTFSDVLRGLPYEDDSYYYFRYKDFIKYLKDYGFSMLRDNVTVARLQEDWEGERHSAKIEGKGVALWKIPKKETTSEPVLKAPEIAKDPF